MNDKPKEQIRAELIHEANQAAEKSDRECSPCVWYICDWVDSLWERRAVALNDALQEKWRMTEDLKKERDELRIKYDRQFQYALRKHNDLLKQIGINKIHADTIDRLTCDLVTVRMKLDELTKPKSEG